MEPLHRLAALLADGEPHAGAELASALGLERGEAAALVGALGHLGLDVDRVQGCGWRLRRRIDLLDERRILDDLPPDVRARVVALEIFPEIDSTNGYLMARTREHVAGLRVCLAERQSAGRGRRGRAWVSPYAANLYMSVLGTVHTPAACLPGLGLAAGVAVARALDSLGAADVALKWPNDVLIDARKLGGVLLESAGEAGAAPRVVIGAGINVDMPACAAGGIGQPWTDLSRAGVRPGRSRLAARVLAEIAVAMAQFDAEGLAPFLAEWRARDALRGREVVLRSPQGEVRGRACGVDESGALLLDVGGAARRVTSGEVSVRALA